MKEFGREPRGFFSPRTPARCAAEALTITAIDVQLYVSVYIVHIYINIYTHIHVPLRHLSSDFVHHAFRPRYPLYPY